MTYANDPAKLVLGELDGGVDRAPSARCIVRRTLGQMGEPRAYVLVTWLNNRGHCQCGWQGKRRLFRGAAVLDVIGHGVETRHMPVGELIRQRIRQG